MPAVLEKPKLEQRFLYRCADWEMYQALSKIFDERPVRLTYDRGRLEFMTLSFAHEKSSNLLGRLVETLTDVLEMPMQSAGSTTMGREGLDRGMESDQCYYLENEPLVRDKDKLDMDHDPPPDLALEIDVTQSSLNRLGICAALRIPEVWRYDGKSLKSLGLGDDGDYHELARSRTFPFLAPKDLRRFFPKPAGVSETEVVRRFRRWVEKHKADWMK